MSGEPSAAAPAPAPGSPDLVEALKKRFAAEVAEREVRHRAELDALRASAAADLAARDQHHAAQLRGFQESLNTDIAARDSQARLELQKLQESYAAHDKARNEQHAAQVRGLEQSLAQMQAQLAGLTAARDDEAQDRQAAETELQARRAQLAAQHLELETHRADLAQFGARVAEVTQALAAERHAATHWHDRAQRLEATLRQVAAQSHDAAVEAAGVVADAHEAAVKRGDDIAEQVGFHEAAVAQLRATIEQQRAAHEQLMAERQAARTRCVELESQLHALTTDARHLAEGLQRVQAERDAERRRYDVPEVEVIEPPRLRLAGSGDSA